MRRIFPAAVAVLLLAACGAGDDPISDDTLPDLPQLSVAQGGSVPTPTAGTSVPTTRQSGAPASTPAPAAPAEPAGPPEVTLTPTGLAEQGLVKMVAGPSERVYAVAQRGVVLLVDEQGAATPALDVSTSITSGGEQGLLGLAFHPALPLAYVNYTDESGDTVIAEYAVRLDGTLDPASARDVMNVDQPYANHNGGNLVFGPDDYLYIGLGDGGSAGDPQRTAQNPSLALGKMLRIDPVAEDGFDVPADNPFISSPGSLGEVWSVGLRNPWRYSFDAATGNLWIGDVGQNAVEEISMAPATGGLGAGKGTNFGWSAFEGNDPFNGDQEAEGHTPPVYTYTHEEGRCSISGGVVFRGYSVPALNGWYVFADYCSGEVWALDVENDGLGDVVELGQVASPVSVDQVGDTLYVVSATEGPLRVEPAS